MTAVAYDDHERRVVEEYAHASLLLAAQMVGAEITGICYSEGLRSVTFACGTSTVEFTYPIWFAANGVEVSWQITVTDAAGEVVATLMTGLTADARRGYLVRLLTAACDPESLRVLCGAALVGSEQVAGVLGIGA
jgi:hypothetical protein